MYKIISHINYSYINENIAVNEDDIEKWIKHPIYNQSLWIKLMNNQQIIATGIAEFDADIKEGIIEWVQVLSEYRNQ